MRDTFWLWRLGHYNRTELLEPFSWWSFTDFALLKYILMLLDRNKISEHSNVGRRARLVLVHKILSRLKQARTQFTHQFGFQDFAWHETVANPQLWNYCYLRQDWAVRGCHIALLIVMFRIISRNQFNTPPPKSRSNFNKIRERKVEIDKEISQNI